MRISHAGTPFFVFVLLFPCAPSSFGVGATQVIAISGDAAPHGGTIIVHSLSRPVINDAGQVGFGVELVGTGSGRRNNQGILRGDGSGLSEIARAGQSIPNTADKFDNFFLPPTGLNETGQATLEATLFVSPGGTFEGFGIYRGDGATITPIARTGQPTGDGDFKFVQFQDPAINNAGQVAFNGSAATSVPGSEIVGIFLGDGLAITQIARLGQTAPDGNGEFVGFSDPALNEVGQTVFRGQLVNTTGGFNDDFGLFRGNGAALTQIVREGQSAPGGNGKFSNFGSGNALNDGGQIAFLTGLTSTIGGVTDNRGIFRSDGVSTTQIVRTGQAAPGGPGQFSRLSSPALNAQGRTAFLAELTGAGGPGIREGIFCGDGATLIQIARAGQFVPDGNGSFLEFSAGDFFVSPLAVNDAGQIAFYADIAGTSGGASDNSAIFFYDENLGLLQVAREGAPLLGSIITSLSFSSSIGGLSNERSGLNNRGRVAYQFGLADGRGGIAIWTIPEPASMTYCIFPIAACAIVVRRRSTYRTLRNYSRRF
jgi:hypothetical protein